jgi:hypothetical protein
MRTLNLLTISLLIFSSAGFTQTKDEKEVAETVEAFRLAMIEGKEAALKDLTTPELSYGHSNGKIEDQATFIGRLVSGDSDFKKIELSDQTIKIVGNNAIVRHKLVAETVDNGTPGNPNLSVLMVFQKQKGKWKLLARQATKLQS